jgi:hypothetical protein
VHKCRLDNLLKQVLVDEVDGGPSVLVNPIYIPSERYISEGSETCTYQKESYSDSLSELGNCFIYI